MRFDLVRRPMTPRRLAARREGCQPKELERRYIIMRGFLTAHGDLVTLERHGHDPLVIPSMMPIEVEQESHKGIWRVVVERDATPPEVKP